MNLKALILAGTVLYIGNGSLRAEEISASEYRVTDVSGQAGFIPHGGTDVSPVVKDLVLEPGDRLVTGTSGRVEFATRQGTVMELKEDSTLEVDDFSTQVSRFFFGSGACLENLHRLLRRTIPKRRRNSRRRDRRSCWIFFAGSRFSYGKWSFEHHCNDR
jgi:hypothetical protein